MENIPEAHITFGGARMARAGIDHATVLNRKEGGGPGRH
jgi:hypothetical protein